jgi:hypothetical protein
MINNQALEVLLDTRKTVLAPHTGKTLDIHHAGAAGKNRRAARAQSQAKDSRRQNHHGLASCLYY